MNDDKINSISGKTDDSNAFDELLNNSTIASKLNDTSRYLAVKIESDTDTYKQFAQICKDKGGSDFSKVPDPIFNFRSSGSRAFGVLHWPVRTAYRDCSWQCDDRGGIPGENDRGRRDLL